MLWFVLSAVMIGALWSALGYLIVAAAVTSFPNRVRRLAPAAAALVAAGAIALGFARVPQPKAVIEAEVHRSHAARCAGSFKAAQRIAHGSLDTVRVAGTSAPWKEGDPVDRSAVIALGGWATDTGSQHPLAGACALVDGKVPARERASYGSTRIDVARAFDNAAVADTGFDIEITAADLAPGAHEVVVVGVDELGDAEPIAPGRTFTVR